MKLYPIKNKKITRKGLDSKYLRVNKAMKRSAMKRCRDCKNKKPDCDLGCILIPSGIKMDYRPKWYIKLMFWRVK